MTFNNPLQVRLYESNEGGFTSCGQHMQLAYGEVAFDACVEEVLSIATESDIHEARLVSLDNHIVRFGLKHPRHISGMRTTRRSNSEHRWFTLEFKMSPGMANLMAFDAFVKQVCALALLFPHLVEDDLVPKHFVDEMAQKCRPKTKA